MSSIVRPRTLAMLGMLFTIAALIPTWGHAQSGQVEIRLDAVRVQSYSKTLTMAIAAPGSAAIAWYVTPALAIDVRFAGLSFSRHENQDKTTRSSTFTQVATYLPFHFGNTRGRSGIFVAPGLTYSAQSGGGITTSSMVSWGAEVGYKKALRSNVSLRAAATYESGDRPETIGATGGVSVFFR